MTVFEKLIEPKKQSVDHSRLLFSNAQIKALMVPLIVEQILNMMIGMVDTAMVSQAGEFAISGVSLVDMLNGVFIMVFSALAAGGAVVVSQILGSGDDARGRKAAGQLISAACVIGLLIMTVIMIANRGLLTLLFGAVEPEVMQASLTYLMITAVSLPMIAVYNASAALFRSMGNSKVTMRVSLLMNLMNMVGNAIAIFVLHAGVAGVAVASVLARLTAALILTVMLFQKNRRIYITVRSIFSFDKELLGKILSIAIPNGIESGFFQICRVTMTSIIATFGTAQIAANGVANSIDNINIIVHSASQLAMTTLIGQCVGANDYDQADYYLRKVLRISAVGSTIICALVLVTLPLILKLYNISPEAQHYVYILVSIHAVLIIVMGWPSGPFPAAIRAAGDVRWMMYASIVSLLVGRLFFSWLFAVKLDFQIVGMWMAMFPHWFGNFLGAWLHYRNGKWKNYRVV